MKGVVCLPDSRCVKMRRIGSRLRMFARMFLILSGRFQPWDTSRCEPREAICLSLKSRLPDFARMRLSLSDFCRIRAQRTLRRT